MTTTLAELLGALLGAPNLDGAACRGLSSTFDPPEPGEDAAQVEHRHGVALALCQGCPALDPCRVWFESLQPRQRPAGVIAGLVVEAHTTRREAIQSCP